MNRNTMLCVDLKTFLQNDRILASGKPYKGVLFQDREGHVVFIEEDNSQFSVDVANDLICRSGDLVKEG